ncbi:MAG: hypothetical protein QW820_06575 [Sulfolobales archaeon]
MVNLNYIREVLEKEPGKLLAIMGIPPYSHMYSEDEKRKVLESLGIVGCSSCLLVSFILDVLLPPPFRPPLMLIACFASRTCP